MDTPTAVQVTLHSASQLHDTNFLTKMDPYVKVQVGSVQHKTTPHRNGGKNPRWEETLTFNYNNEEFINFQVLDKDTLTADDYIGSGDFPVRHIASSAERAYSGTVPLTWGKGKKGGFLNVTIRFYGSLTQTSGGASADNATQAQGNAKPQSQMAPSENGHLNPQMAGYPPQPYPGHPGAGVPMMMAQPYLMGGGMMGDPQMMHQQQFPPQPGMQFNPNQPYPQQGMHFVPNQMYPQQGMPFNPMQMHPQQGMQMHPQQGMQPQMGYPAPYMFGQPMGNPTGMPGVMGQNGTDGKPNAACSQPKSWAPQ